ncbi:MAG: hypothetical protein ACOC16_01940 [Nanoarchaeota archaeon]
MSDEIINPFKQNINKNWVKKTNQRFSNVTKKNQNKKKQIENKDKTRIAKSFKIYKGTLARDFDKRVTKLQVKFDDLDFEKNYVDSGKYIMFLMAFAEKYKLYELFQPTNGNGDINIEKEKLLKYFKNLNK